MTEKEELERAISTLEARRAVLGNAVVDASIAALRGKLAALQPPPSTDQQRKQVTVLFADVSGFTAIAEPMDPEDVSELINALWERLDKDIMEHRGTVDKHIGDKVMALWGVKTAREDDPERAIRAALAIQAEIRDFNSETQPVTSLQMRIGINTGPVFLGQVGIKGEYTAMGDTVNTASRLEEAAPIGGILISHDTYRHVRGIFDVQPIESIQVKGKAEPIRVYVVQRAKPRAFRRGIRGVEGVETRMIGRETELKQLQDALGTVIKDGEQQMITIAGEAGVGKSRLLYEFEDWVDLLPERIRYFKGRASLEMQNLPYALIRDLFAFRFQIQDSDRASVVREKMEWGIGEVLGDDEQTKAHFIGQLLGFDFSDSPHLQGVLDDPKQIHDRALIYLGEFFRATTEQAPAVIFLEDTHWADDSSLEAISHLARTTPDCRLLTVCLARSTLFERWPHWGEGLAFHTRLELQPLSERDSRHLVEEILQKVDQVPEALRKLVVSKAEGNPFYVEELIKILIEDGVIVKGEEHWQVEPDRLMAVRVPPTLTGVIQARLDSLPSTERMVLQRASVVGRRFWDGAVVHISKSEKEDSAEKDVPHTLSALRGKEMVFRQETSAFAGTQEYIFKHAVLRDVTYESVLKRLRRACHALVAEWLIERSGERAGEVTGLIADHLELAGQTEQALPYLRRAGEQAATQFANVEAVNYLSRALDLTPEDDLTERYILLLAREKVYNLQGKREAQRRDLASLEALAGALDDDRQQAEVTLRQAHYAEATGDYPAAIAAARVAIDLTRGSKAASLEAAGYLQWGRVLWRQGDYVMARPQLERALSLARSAQLRQVEANSLLNLGNVSSDQSDFTKAKDHYEQARRIFHEIGDRRGESGPLHNLGNIFLKQGNFTKARTSFEQAMRIYHEIGDRQSEGMAIGGLGIVSAHQDDFVGAKKHYEQALRIFREIGDKQSEGIALDNLGAVSAHQGDPDGARDYYEQALCIYREIGDRQGESRSLGNLGSSFANLGNYTEARAYYEQALVIKREIGDRQGEGVRLADLSLLSHHRGNDKAAQEYSQQALRIAHDIGDRHTEGYALTNLGHALTGLGHLTEAADVYRQALTLRRGLGEGNLGTEPWAALARISLAQGDPTQALTHVEKILSHLESGTLDGTDEPFRIYLTCYRVLRANRDPRAQGILNEAHRQLQERAAKIGDEELRRSYLENVAAHREIVSEWQVANDVFRLAV